MHRRSKSLLPKRGLSSLIRSQGRLSSPIRGNCCNICISQSTSWLPRKPKISCLGLPRTRVGNTVTSAATNKCCTKLQSWYSLTICWAYVAQRLSKVPRFATDSALPDGLRDSRHLGLSTPKYESMRPAFCDNVPRRYKLGNGLKKRIVESRQTL